LAIVLAGGKGTRLGALTRREAKPALPFGGQCRNVDFALSNCVNSGIGVVSVLTQYQEPSLIRHIGRVAADDSNIEIWPAARVPDGRYSGTADAVFRNRDLIAARNPRRVLGLAGDHVYKMDYQRMLDAHIRSGAAATVACIEVPLTEAKAFGVMSTDARGWITAFVEKPADPVPLPNDRNRALASMGIYVFDCACLLERLERDAGDPASQHDFGRNILPALIAEARVLAYALPSSSRGERAYWRDVGTIDSYWQANLDLLAERPALDLHDETWPIFTQPPTPRPARFIGGGAASVSIVAAGCRVAGRVRHSVLSADCSIAERASVEDAVLLPGAQIGRDCVIRKAVVDSGCVVPDGFVIGRDSALDAEFYDLTPRGVALVTAEGVAKAAAAAATALESSFRGPVVRLRQSAYSPLHRLGNYERIEASSA
ncbi:MAG TPA: sugar phosphate nucleotidyltransferase, partial [Gammaproteobacteria bacterium]|nr:sugar phosphate nucleotidyltransferase [Gammaproteobacteria bacterium]